MLAVAWRLAGEMDGTMSETTTEPTRKPRPAGPRQCPRCHRDLWEPCLQCRQTGLQRPGIVWCIECREPGRGKRCSKCGKAVPSSSKAGGTCPHCGTYWDVEKDSSGRTVSTAYRAGQYTGIAFLIGLVVWLISRGVAALRD